MLGEPRNMSVLEDWLEIEVLPADGSEPFENSVPVSEIDGFVAQTPTNGETP